MRACITSRGGGAAGVVVIFLLLAAGGVFALGYANVWTTRSKVDQIINSLPTTLERSGGKQIEQYLAQQIAADTVIDAATLKVQATNAKGLVEVSLKYQVPVNLFVVKWNASVTQRGQKALGDSPQTNREGRTVQPKGSRHSEHTETYSIP